MPEPEMLRFDGTVELQAASGGDAKRPTFKILAYSGGELRLPAFSAAPVVIDLAGMDCAAPVPVAADHDTGFDSLIGHGRARVADGQLHVAGEVSQETEAARQFVASAKADFPWQASIGAQPLERISIRPGETIRANGRIFKAGDAGLTLVPKSRLREVSILALAADDGSRVDVAATSGGIAMTQTQTTQTPADPLAERRAAEAAETQRIVSIRAACAGKHSEIEAKAIADGWTLDRAELEILKAERPKAPTVFAPHGFAPMRETLGAGAMLLAGFDKAAVAAYGEEATQRAHELRLTGLPDLVRAALVLDGVTPPHNVRDLVEAGFSTVSMPVLLGDTVERIVLSQYLEAPATWTGFAKEIDLPDFKSADVARPSFIGNVEKLPPGGEFKHAQLGEFDATIRIDTFGKILRVTRQAVINDDRGVLNEAAPALGRMARRGLNDLVWATVIANAGNHFAEGHGNVITGATSAMGTIGLGMAIQAIRTQRDTEHNDLDLQPVILAVPPELEQDAIATLESEFIQQLADAGGPTGNPLRKAVRLAVESRLSNTEKFPTADAKAWYLFASPADAPVVVAYLSGARGPTVEYFGMDHDADTLGMAWRVFFDYGAALVDWRAAVRSAGE